MKTFYSINPGEFFTAAEIKWERKDLKIYFPLDDEGVDLVTMPRKGRGKAVRIQVKESRSYSGQEHSPHSWHQIRTKKLGDADIFVFVTYLPRGRHSPALFERRFLVFPKADLARLCRRKKIAAGKHDFYFCFGCEDGRILESREKTRKVVDVTKYLDAWDLI